jgi:hypothetical protein
MHNTNGIEMFRPKNHTGTSPAVSGFDQIHSAMPGKSVFFKKLYASIHCIAILCLHFFDLPAGSYV